MPLLADAHRDGHTDRDRGPVHIDEPPMPAVSRSSNDVIRVAIAVAVFALALVTAIFSPTAIQALERDLLTFVGNLPRSIENFVIAFIQVSCLYAPLVLVVSMLVLRRFRRLLVVLATAIVTAPLLRVTTLVVEGANAGRSPNLNALSPLTPLLARGLRSANDLPSITYVAVATAIVTVEGPWLTRPWRRASRVIVGALAFAHLAARDNADRGLPIDIGIALALGWLVGLLVLLAAGRPNRRARGRDIVDALAGFGLQVRSLRIDSSRLSDSLVYRVRCTDEAPLLVKLTNVDDQGSHVLSRLYRFVRVREVGDEHPFWPPLRAREHEALIAFAARDAGVRTPRVRAVGSARHGDAALLAFEAVEGATIMSSLPDQALDDDVLRQAWDGARLLREHHIAHRDLRVGNLLRDEAGQVWIVNFDAAQLQADDALLANDVAELLTSTAVRVGAERAVAAAISALGPEAVVSALPRLQPLALSRTTRSEVKQSQADERQPEKAEHGDDSQVTVGQAGERASLLEEIAAQVCAHTGAEEVPLEQLQRLRARTILLFFMSAFALYALLPFVADASDIVAEVRNADYTWFAVALLASAISYLAAAIALTGAVPGRVRFSTTTVAQIASQFVNFATPASVGGMALNVRYLQKQGTDPPVAVAAVGLNVVAGFMVHLALLMGVAVWAGSDESATFHLPEATTVGAVAAFILGLMVLALLVPPSRSMILHKGVPIVKRSLLGIVEVARHPTKLLELLGGSALLTCAYAAALVASVYAFGGDLSVATIVLVFLAGSAVASVAPTPGGLGAVEAALIGGLTSVGLEASIAVSAVVIFRLATFWLPLAPGWFAFRRLEKHDAI
jgi:uncharacterized membrane protein YbhN (UPF0104 family)